MQWAGMPRAYARGEEPVTQFRTECCERTAGGSSGSAHGSASRHATSALTLGMLGP
jgi:hypothetical protein